MMRVRVVPFDYNLIASGDTKHTRWPASWEPSLGQIFLFVEVNRDRTLLSGREIKCVVTEVGPVQMVGGKDIMSVHWRHANLADEAADLEIAPIVPLESSSTLPAGVRVTPIVRVRERWIWTPPALVQGEEMDSTAP